MKALTLVACLALASFAAPGQDDKFLAEYQRAAQARDSAALEALWKQSPGLALPTFDQDLEGSLALWEQSPDKPDQAGIEALEARALFAAQNAAATLGRPLLADYAASFVGWSDIQRLDFRAGQRAFGKARELQGKGDFAGALAAAEDCARRAESLGDWWGLAMGSLGSAEALLALERFDESLIQAARARLINQGLGLTGDELKSALVVAESCAKLGRFERGLAAAQAAVDGLQKAPKERRRRALAARLANEEGLGLTEQAQATQAALKALD